jgi:RND superfamily putative drug exporter
MLLRIARTSFHHRRLVLALWLLAFVAAVTIGPALAGDYANTGRLSHTDSQAAYDSLARDFPQRHGGEGRIVFADIQKDRGAIDAYLAKVAHAEGVISVDQPRISKGGHIAVVPVTTANGDSDHPKDIANHIVDLAAPLRDRGVDVQFSGTWFSDTSTPASELIGVVVAVVVLLIAFGSLIAMGLPITTALLGIVVSLAGVGIVAHLFTTPTFVPQVAAMIGIGVGIDYALFIVTRYRSALHRTGSPEAAVLEAMNTSGRAVLFAGITVMISVLGIFLMNLNFLHGLGVGKPQAVGKAHLDAMKVLAPPHPFVG